MLQDKNIPFMNSNDPEDFPKLPVNTKRRPPIGSRQEMQIASGIALTYSAVTSE
jgi:hypothetical protein